MGFGRRPGRGKGPGQRLQLSGEAPGRGASLPREQGLGCELAQVRRPDLAVAAVVSQCSRRADRCQGPGPCRLTLMLQIHFTAGTPSLNPNLGSQDA